MGIVPDAEEIDTKETETVRLVDTAVEGMEMLNALVAEEAETEKTAGTEMAVIVQEEAEAEMMNALAAEAAEVEMMNAHAAEAAETERTAGTEMVPMAIVQEEAEAEEAVQTPPQETDFESFLQHQQLSQQRGIL